MKMLWAVAFLLGVSAVSGEKLSCDEVQKRLLQFLPFTKAQVTEISNSNFDTLINFHRIPPENMFSSQTAVTVSPEQKILPTVNIDGKSYKLLELRMVLLPKIDEGAAFMTIFFSEDGYNTRAGAVRIFVPLILTEQNDDPDCNRWLSTDLALMSNLNQNGGYEVNSMVWLQELLKTVDRFAFLGVPRNSYMTGCETVPSNAIKDFFKV